MSMPGTKREQVLWAGCPSTNCGDRWIGPYGFREHMAAIPKGRLFTLTLYEGFVFPSLASHRFRLNCIHSIARHTIAATEIRLPLG